MKHLLSILLLSIFLLPMLVKLEILLNFKINQDFISEAWCINKEEPMTMCYGKCFLANKLKMAEEQEQKDLPNSVNQKLEILICRFTESIHVGTPSITENISNSEYIPILYQFSYLKGIFHPPKKNSVDLV